MPYRRIRPPDEKRWRNPIPGVDSKPALDDVLFPADIRTPRGGAAGHSLRMLYSDSRKAGEEDELAFERYLRSPESQYLILWGEVGIGKSYFVRYHLDRLKNPDDGDAILGGVVDMLRGSSQDALRAVYRQLCPLLEEYFTLRFGSPKDAILQYAAFEAQQRLGESAPDTDVLPLANEIASNAMEKQFGEEYGLFLLSALEYFDDRPIFIVVDNIDRTPEIEQDMLLQLATRLLRNSQIRMVIPLRKTSALLGDRFKGLQEFRWLPQTLSPLILEDMLKKRFERSWDGTPLDSVEVYDPENDKTFRYLELFRLLFPEDEEESSGQLLAKLAGPNARIFLAMVAHVLKSEQLDDLANLKSQEYVLAALMLSDESAADRFDTFVINLFENQEPGVYGNNLIRYRILEFFQSERRASPLDAKFERHFIQILEYQMSKILAVIALFVSRGILESDKHLVPDDIMKCDLDEIGSFVITDSGAIYFEYLLKRMWYYVAAKRSILLPDEYRQKDPRAGHEYVTHTGLVNFLAGEEAKEAQVRHLNESAKGQLGFLLTLPSEAARRALHASEPRTASET